MSLDRRIVELPMDWKRAEEKTRSRSRSARRRNHNATSRRSGHRTNARVKDTPRCNHLPPPPYRPAGPFALFFAAHLGGVEAEEVIYMNVKLQPYGAQIIIIIIMITIIITTTKICHIKVIIICNLATSVDYSCLSCRLTSRGWKSEHPPSGKSIFREITEFFIFNSASA